MSGTRLPWEGSDNDSRITHLCRRAIRAVMEFTNKRSQYFVTNHERAKSQDEIGTWADEDDFSSVAIVMQGPLWSEHNLTIDTLKLYKKHFPGCRLILSTWNDTPEADLEPIKALGVDLVLSEKPKDPGFFNINMQIISAGNGVKEAIKGGATWIMKTRTDQRLYNPNVLSFLISTAKAFPVTKTELQRYRIIGVGQASLKYAPYHITDQTVFGHAEDMLKYWTPALRVSNLTQDEIFKKTEELYLKSTIRELCSTHSPESYFGSQFILSVGHKELKWTVEDHWAALRDHFCFIDYPASDFYWYKGQGITLKESMARYDCISNRAEMYFNDWLLLYTGQVPVELGKEYEAAADKLFHCAVDNPRG